MIQKTGGENTKTGSKTTRDTRDFKIKQEIRGSRVSQGVDHGSLGAYCIWGTAESACLGALEIDKDIPHLI